MKVEFKTGDYVKWFAKTGTETSIRAGRVLAKVLAYQHPNELGFGEVVNKVLSPRTEDSYLVYLPKHSAVMWPMAEHLLPLADSEMGILEYQKTPPVTAKRIADHYDRCMIIALALSLGDGYFSTSRDLTVENWGRRFEFAVADGVEYVSNVYSFEVERS